jgi:hypothetical protein
VKRVTLAAGALAIFAACQPTLDTTRTPTDEATFGAIVYTIGCQHLAFQLDPSDVEGNTYRSMCRDGTAPPSGTPPALLALNTKRSSLIASIDEAAPSPLLPDLQGLLVSILPLYDNGVLDAANKTTGPALVSMANNSGLVSGLSHIDGRLGYRPSMAAYGLLRAVMEYPNLGGFTDATLPFIGPLGAAGHAPFESLAAAAAYELQAAQPADPTDPQRTLLLALQLFFTQDPNIGSGTAHPLVVRDTRGIAQVTLDSTGAVPPPFSDMNGTGQADVDEFGRFVDASGQPLDLYPFQQADGTGSLGGTLTRNSLGEALNASGAPVFQYVDLDQTVLAAAVRDGLTLMDPTQDTALQAMMGTTALLGARKAQTATSAGHSISFQGFDTGNSAFLDMIYGFLEMLGDPNAIDTLELARTLVANNEADTARLINALLTAKDMANADTTASIPRTSDLIDELIPLIIQTLETPGLVEDLVNAMANTDGYARTANLAQDFAQYASFKDRYDIVPGTPLCSAPDACDYPSVDLDGPDFSVAVDRTMRDIAGNRSIFQRLAWLIHDTNGVQWCSKAGAVIKDPYLGVTLQTFTNPCDGLEIDDLALFFLKAIGMWDFTQAVSPFSAQMVCSEPSSGPGAHVCPINSNNLNFAASAGMQLFSAPLSQLTTIDGLDNANDSRPTPVALARSLFLNPSPAFLSNMADPALCSDGHLITQDHGETMMALEHNYFYFNIYPVAHAFAIHGDAAIKILANMFSVLHNHWPSPASGFQNTNPTQPYYATLDGAETYEPLMSQIFNGDLVPALVNAIPDLQGATVPSGVSGVIALHNAANYVFDPQYSPGLTYRSGATTTVESDGVTPVTAISPFYVIADAMSEKRTALDAGGPAAAAWKTSTSNMVNQFLGINISNGYSFSDRNFVAITLDVIPWMEQRISTHQTAGDQLSWVQTTLAQDEQSVLAGPVLAALADFATAMESDPAAKAQFYGLLRYLNDGTANPEAFSESLTGVADMMQTFLDDPDMVPVAQGIGTTLAPATGVVDAQLALLSNVQVSDDQHVVPQILHNLWVETAPGQTPIAGISTAVGETNRASAGSSEPYTPADYADVMSTVGNFLTDDDHGLQRFVDVVKQRNP